MARDCLTQLSISPLESFALIVGAPANVAEKQLQELSIKSTVTSAS